MMRTRMICLHTGLVLVLTALSCVARADAIYKWRDADGVVHYGNTLPAKDAGLAGTTMDKHGLVVKQTPAAPTEQQRQAMQAEAARQARLQAAQIEQQRQDTALLNTYTSPSEIDLARDHNLELVQLVINGIQSRLGLLYDKRQQLLRESGGNIPTSGNTATEFNANEQHIRDLTTQLQQKNRELAATRSKYDAEKARFIELTSTSRPSQVQ